MEWWQDIRWGLELRMVANLMFAMVLCGLRGLNRERADRTAGLRTQMLVVGAAAFLVNLAALLAERFQLVTEHADIEVDPTRVIQAIVIGIGFLGAGTIFKHAREDKVEGLTTAASLLLASVIGIAVGMRLYVAATLATLLALLVLTVVAGIERSLGRQQPRKRRRD